MKSKSAAYGYIVRRLVLLLLVATLLSLTAREMQQSVPKPLRDFRAALKDGAPQPPADKTDSVAPATAPVSEAQHDSLGDTLRASGGALDIEGKTLPLNEADWQKPFPLTFAGLRKEYLHYKRNADFAPEGLPRLHGGAVSVSGAVMPIDPPPPSGEMRRFWLANPTVVMAGCVFCNPPTMADLIYVEAAQKPLKIDREELYRSVTVRRLLGRFFVEQRKTADGVEYLFRLEMKKVDD